MSGAAPTAGVDGNEDNEGKEGKADWRAPFQNKATKAPEDSPKVSRRLAAQGGDVAVQQAVQRVVDKTELGKTTNRREGLGDQTR